MAPLPDEQLRDETTTVTAVRTQYDPRAATVPAGAIRLRWAVRAEAPDARQIGYQLRHRTDGGTWRPAPPVATERALDIDAGDIDVRERRGYAVRIATAAGWTAWSDTREVEGAPAGKDLRAEVISIPSLTTGPAIRLRTEFDLASAPTQARLHLSALGVCSARVNGHAAGDAVLTPGWTSYQERILLDAIEVAPLLRAGRNAIEITIADGWYRGRMGFAGRTEIYGEQLGAIAQLEAVLPGGAVVVVATDESWRGSESPIRSASIYDGTTIDATLDDGDASVPGFDDGAWHSVSLLPVDRSVFVARSAPPVRVVATLPMMARSRTETTMLDAGQNIAGWVRLTVDGRRGQTVTVRHAEVLEPDGGLHVAALRTAKATDTYVLGRDGAQILEPAFTFHGFRYAEVTGSAEVVRAEAVAISSDLTPRSRFASSQPALDRFHENVRWSQRDNFVSLPTDCPQRDERLGWTGDAQAFAATANTLFDSERFWASWLRDLEADQTDEGGVASVVPNIIAAADMEMNDAMTETMGRAGWADAATIVPLAVYDAYGASDVLRAQLRSMRRWIAHLERRAGVDVLLPEEPFQYGDWLDPDAPGDRPWDAKTPALFVANCFYVHSTRLLARAERVLGETEAAQRTDALADRVSAAVWERWAQEAARTHTGAAMCLVFDIVPSAQRQALAAALAQKVHAENGRISTGFLGTPLILDALSANGHLDAAYRMLLRREAPSWLYQVDRGATTVWERWDAIKPDGSIHRGEMATKEGDSMISFNHYAYGAVIDWVYRTVAGVAPAAPGYARVRIAPRPASALRHASAAIETSFGEIAIAWRLDDHDALSIDLDIPFGVTAELDLPVTTGSEVSVGGGSAPASLSHGHHAIRVSAAAVAAVTAPEPVAS